MPISREDVAARQVQSVVGYLQLQCGSYDSSKRKNSSSIIPIHER